MSTPRRPSSIDGIKRLAKQLRREKGIKYHQALDEAAVLARFQNFKHALKALANPPSPMAQGEPFPGKPLALADFHKLSLDRWVAAVEAVNPQRVGSTSWTGRESIAGALKGFVGRAANHAHLPSGGGLDYESVAFSHEPECLEFAVGHSAVHIVRPARLTLERIDGSPDQSFLLLELAELAPSGVYDHDFDEDDMDGRARVLRRDHEELLEADGEYFDRSVWDQGHLGYGEYGHQIPLPENRRIVSRWLRGKILFVAKGSLWNGTPRTYNGMHNRMSAIDIRALIERSLPIAA